MLLANPRKLRTIYKNDRKCDRKDAEMLAKLARADKDKSNGGKAVICKARLNNSI